MTHKSQIVGDPRWSQAERFRAALEQRHITLIHAHATTVAGGHYGRGRGGREYRRRKGPAAAPGQVVARDSTWTNVRHAATTSRHQQAQEHQ